MLKKAAFIFWILCAALMFGMEAAAQTVRAKTEYIDDSILAKMQMPNGAIGLRDKDLPKEIDWLIDETFKMLYAKFAKRGRTEVIYWEFGESSPAKAELVTHQIRLAFSEAGWHLIESPNPQYLLINLINIHITGGYLNAFIIPAPTGCTLVLTEIKRFPPPKSIEKTSRTKRKPTKGAGLGNGLGNGAGNGN
jgi:hypothetical protein